MISEMLNVSPAPHIKSGRTINNIMIDVIIALMPTVAVLCYFDFLGNIKLISASLISALLAEGLWNKYVKKSSWITDLSPIITALILVVIMPTHVPIWIIAIGNIFAIIVVKMFFGGLGQNFMNPAAAAKIFLITTWGTIMTLPIADGSIDMASTVGHPNLALIIAIGLGGIYLTIRGVINMVVPIVFIGVSLLTYITLGHGFVIPYTVVFAGVFMVTDYSTTPMNIIGKIIFALSSGILGSLIILKGGNPEGVYFAIIILNLFTPMIEQLSAKKVVVKEVEVS